MIDVVLVALLVLYAVSGYRQGVLVGVLSLGGFLGGALLAIWLAPKLAGGLAPGTQRSVVVLLAVLLTAWLGQFAGAMVGGRLREGVPHGAAAIADQVAGALAGVVSVALVVWFVAGAIRGGPVPWLARTVGSSRVIATIDSVMPDGADRMAGAFRSVVGDSSFPKVFTGIGPEQISPIEPPDGDVPRTAAVRRAARSVVKITGEAVACSRGQEGSGVVAGARDRVVTNAHVVAGMRTPHVQVGGAGRSYDAVVVAFDARRDLAVLWVPDLPVAPLKLAPQLARGASAVVAGYPNDGPFRANAARVREVRNAIGEDIYGSPGAEREIYSLYARVRPGNSGGPVLTPAGRVAGIVFAKSLDDGSTGYALTPDEVNPVLAGALRSTTPISTGGCALG